MNHLVSMQTALDAITEIDGGINMDIFTNEVREILRDLPPEECLTVDDIEVIRIHMSAHKEELCNQCRWKEAEEYQGIVDRLMKFAKVLDNQ